MPALNHRVTLPRHFAANGYRTLTTGKIYHDSGMPKDDFQVVGPIPGQRAARDARIIPETPDGARGLWDFGSQAYEEALFQDHADATWAIGKLSEVQEKPFFLTIVILYSDHGFFPGEKQHWAKQSLWERATRVPMIISAPGSTQGQTCARPAELLSIYPTLIDLCGLTNRKDIDGTSLVPLLGNPQAEWNRPAPTSHFPNNHSVRTERYRYTRYHDGSEELDDHQSDPNEWTNLAPLPEHAELKRELAGWFPEINLPPATVGKPKRGKRR